ncbi:steroid monooxygenase [Xylaria scruposa]|nr:steroid monooxygenase [Xylaria scruposa]
MSKHGLDYDAIVIGAGLSGIRSLWELNRLGLTAQCFDAASDVGGAWWWNRYPGCRTDGEAWVYCLNFLPELLEEWKFTERYPSHQEVQWYLSRIVDRYDLRKNIEFNTEVKSAHYNDSDNTWTITTAKGGAVTCRYFLPATGVTSVPKHPSFPGLQSFKGDLYQASTWPHHEDIDLQDKRIGVIGTGSTGVQIITKLAPVAKHLTVFQRTPNYVIPARNYSLDRQKIEDVKKDFDDLWQLAKRNLGGHAIKHSGETIANVGSETAQETFEEGWKLGCYNFQLGTFDDVYMTPDSNKITADFVREKIRDAVRDPATAELLCPKFPLGARRSPCGDGYYETFNRENVQLINISNDGIDICERGIQTASGTIYELDVIILALGFDTGTGAMNQIDIKGSQGRSLRESWAQRLETFAGVLVHGYPNMFIVCGPHLVAGNQPVSLEVSASWIGETIEHMEQNGLDTIDVSNEAMDSWTTHVEQVWQSLFLAKHAEVLRSWFVGTNIPGKPASIMFYFAGIRNLELWLAKERDGQWQNMTFKSEAEASKSPNGVANGHSLVSTLGLTVDTLESMRIPLQAEEIGIAPDDRSVLVNAAAAAYLNIAVKEMRARKLEPVQDYRVHWWKTTTEFVDSEEGQGLIQEAPVTLEGLERLTSKLGIEGETLARMGPEVMNIMIGKTHSLAHIMEDDLLFRVYLSDEGKRLNRYVSECVKRLTSQKKDIRILEIGAGTGGTTQDVLKICSPSGERFCAHFMYTDLSPGFFVAGKTTLKKWERLLTFKVFNVMDNPAGQGFEEGSYDFIYAANVIHATSSLMTSLTNIRKLLKPGGTVALLELSRLTSFYNLVFGSLPGWWEGVGEGRIESPLQTPEQWDELLKKAGFSGIDLITYDLQGPERHYCMMLSTAL